MILAGCEFQRPVEVARRREWSADTIDKVLLPGKEYFRFASKFILLFA